MTPTDLCNAALDLVPSATIVTLDENSLQAKACRRWFPTVLAELLEVANWGFNRRTVALPLLAENPLMTRWGFAYNLPADCAMPLNVLTGGGFSDWNANVNGMPAVSARQAFAIAGNILFTNTPNAFFEYITSETLLENTYAGFRKVLYLELAAAISLPITKDAKRRRDLLQEAEVARQRATANAFNREPKTYGDFMPDAVRAHMGLLIDASLAPALNAATNPTGLPGTGGTGGTGGGTTTPTIYAYPDWSALFENALNFDL